MVTHKDQGGYACDDEAPYGHIKELTYINRNTDEKFVFNNAGIRVKGNTSCDDPVDQKSFKIKLNPVDKIIEDQNDNEVWRIQNVYEEWGNRIDYPEDVYKHTKKQNLFGLTSFTIRRGSNDQSRLHDVLSSDIFEYAGDLARKHQEGGAPLRGGAVYRAGLVYVRIHNGFGTLMDGFYQLVELPDDDMIASHYGKNAIKDLFKIKEGKGTFLDSDMPADPKLLLTWYQPEVIDGDGYTGDEEFDIKQKLCAQGKYKQSKCDDLLKERKKAEKTIREFQASLKEAANAPTLAERRQKLSTLLDIDNFLSYMAAANLSGHWDSMVDPIANNDFLFHNGKTKKWAIVAWDLDNTFGSPGQNYPWMAKYNEFGVDLKHRPLFKAVMDNYGTEYKSRMQEFLNGVYDFDKMGAKITFLRDQTAPNSHDDKFENLFRFKNHRWGNVWCNLNQNGKKVKIKNGWPDIYQQNGQYSANCE